MTTLERPATAGAPHRVLLVDDHPLLRRGLGDLIGRDPELEVCGEAADADAAVDRVAATSPHLVVLDISMPGGDGIELLSRLNTLYPDVTILVLSMHDEALYAERVLRMGARGYVMKHETPQEVMHAIHRVLTGRVYLSAAMTERVIERSATTPPSATPVESLSDRELQVMRLMGEGLGTSEIAEALCLSSKTIDTHRMNLKRKLGLKTHSELMRYAVRWSEGAET